MAVVTMINITPDNPANDLDPLYSPDGKSIVYGRQTTAHFYGDNVQMVIYNISTTLS
jgi:hypothetical protein